MTEPDLDPQDIVEAPGYQAPDADPTDPEVTDPADPNFVEPMPGVSLNLAPLEVDQ